ILSPRNRRLIIVSDPDPRPSPWHAIAAATALNAPLGSLYAFSVCLTPLESLLALSRAELALVFAVASAAFGGGMNLVPHVYGLASPPVLVVACGAVSALGIALAAAAGGLAQLVIGYGVLFGAGGGAGYILMQQAVNLAAARPRPPSTAPRSSPAPSPAHAWEAGGWPTGSPFPRLPPAPTPSRSPGTWR